MSKGFGWAGLVVLSVALLLNGGAARADTVITNGPGGLVLSNCGDAGSACPAATYTFSIDLTTHQASLTIAIAPAATLVTSGKQENDYISGVDLGFTNSANITSLTMGAVPPNSGTWTPLVGSLNNSGCGGNNGAFACTFANPGVKIVDGGSYTWTWNFTLAPNSQIFSTGDIHIGANYNPANGEIVSCTSGGGECGSSSVPEPGTLSSLGAGLLFLIGIGRRRLANS